MRVFPTFSLFKSMRKIQNEPFICAGSRANSPRQSIGLDHGYLTNEGKPQVSISDFFCSCHPPKSVKRNSWNVKKLLPRPRRNLQQNFARISIKSVKGRCLNMALGSGKKKKKSIKKGVGNFYASQHKVTLARKSLRKGHPNKNERKSNRGERI